MACARLRTRESHARACYLTCDLPSTSGVGSHVQSRLYMFAYLGGDTPGTEMEMTIKKFTKKYKSHRRIGTMTDKNL